MADIRRENNNSESIKNRSDNWIKGDVPQSKKLQRQKRQVINKVKGFAPSERLSALKGTKPKPKGTSVSWKDSGDLALDMKKTRSAGVVQSQHEVDSTSQRTERNIQGKHREKLKKAGATSLKMPNKTELKRDERIQRLATLEAIASKMKNNDKVLISPEQLPEDVIGLREVMTAWSKDDLLKEVQLERTTLVNEGVIDEGGKTFTDTKFQKIYDTKAKELKKAVFSSKLQIPGVFSHPNRLGMFSVILSQSPESNKGFIARLVSKNQPLYTEIKGSDGRTLDETEDLYKAFSELKKVMFNVDSTTIQAAGGTDSYIKPVLEELTTRQDISKDDKLLIIHNLFKVAAGAETQKVGLMQFDKQLGAAESAIKAQN